MWNDHFVYLKKKYFNHNLPLILLFDMAKFLKRKKGKEKNTIREQTESFQIHLFVLVNIEIMRKFNYVCDLNRNT